MTIPINSATNLEALNTMLSAIGQAPVSDFSSTSNLDVIMARNKLTETSRAVQETGWTFNTDYDFELQPDVGTSEIAVEADMARIDVNKRYHAKDVIVQRGLRLYNATQHTYQFDGPVVADVVRYLEWEDMPDAAQHYVTARASRGFAEDRLGASNVVELLRRREGEALVFMKQHHTTTTDRNMLGNIPALRRRTIRRNVL